mmetsp:Transcript_17183/g.34216  ORF Transcript_17183/g.34216 Transcript_17183/m.34216 type:complete len:338 (+) Transcript_17183:183-1196(+)
MKFCSLCFIFSSSIITIFYFFDITTNIGQGACKKSYHQNLYAGNVQKKSICNERIPHVIKNSKHPYEINELRRHLGLHNPDYLAEHMQLFSEAFAKRLNNTSKHLSLHIPKAGGTSICNAVKRSAKFTSPQNNCWERDTCPLWCCCENPKPMTCNSLSHLNFSFVMNENWLDPLCDDRVYSVLVREPVSRAVSHVNHFLEGNEHYFYASKERFDDAKGWRLPLIQSNYMTWSLTAGTAVSGQDPRFFRPSGEHLEEARRVLRRLDFVVNLGHPDKICTNAIFKLMGLSSPVDKSNGREGYEKNFHRADYERMNELDLQLYAYANKLIELDCKFFLQL